jgi:hypothetical protein
LGKETECLLPINNFIGNKRNFFVTADNLFVLEFKQFQAPQAKGINTIGE